MKREIIVATLIGLNLGSYAIADPPKNFKPQMTGLFNVISEDTVGGETSRLEDTICVTDAMAKDALSAKTDCKVVYLKDTASESDAEMNCPKFGKMRVKQRYLDKVTLEFVTESKYGKSRMLSKYLGKCSAARK